MARLTPEKKEDIKNALLLGDSQYKVSQDFEVSSATVNKIYKSIPKEDLEKVKDIVKDEVAIKTILSEQSERFSKSFEDKVNDEVRRRGLVFNASELLIKRTANVLAENKTVEKINVGDGMQQFESRELNPTDLKNLGETLDKASITLNVNQRHANSQVTVNTQNNNMQQLELNKEVVTQTLENFENEY